MIRRAPVGAYRLAMRAYPRSIRGRFGGDEVEAFQDAYQERRAQGFVPALLFALRATAEAVRGGVRDRLGGTSGIPGGDGEGRLSGTLRDARFAARSLRSSPGFTFAVILTLALAIGANAAIFSVIDAVVLRPLPYPDPDRVVTVWASRLDRGVLRWGVSAWDFRDWDERSDSFAALGMYLSRDGNLTGAETAQRVGYALVTSPFFAALGVEPAAGRWLTEDEDVDGAAVAVIGSELAASRFGSAAEAVGADIQLDGRLLRVVGVMPAGFDFPSAIDVWLPFETPAIEDGRRGSYFVRSIARLADGVAVAQAHADIDGIMTALQEEYPETNAGVGGYVERLLDTSVGSARQQLLVVQGIVLLVFLVAGANVSNLFLSRATTRGGEIALRAALGATTRRLVRQLITEGLLLALAGGIVGLFLARLLLPAIASLGASTVPRLETVPMNGTVLAFSLALSLLGGVVFAVLPAIRVASGNVADLIRNGGRTLDGSGQKSRRLFIVGQVAIAFVILLGASLLLRSFLNVMAIDPGFDVTNTISLRIEPPWITNPNLGRDEFMASIAAERVQVNEFFGQLTSRLTALPDIRAAALVNVRPFAPANTWNTTFEVDGEPLPEQDRPATFARVTTPEYLETIGLRLIRGRWLSDTDTAATPRVAVISASAAANGFGEADPIGRRITTEGAERAEAAWYEVVGVVADVPSTNLERPTNPMIYTPFTQGRFGHFRDWGMDLVVRAEPGSSSVASAVRDIVGELRPDLPVFDIQTLEEAADARLARRRFTTTLLTLFAGLALLLTLIGVYGVISYSVGQRVREIGIRLALGARPGGIVTLVARDAGLLTLLGIVLGALLALASAGIVENMLFGVQPRDPATMLAAAGLLALTTVVAFAVPAWRSSRLDPTNALREE